MHHHVVEVRLPVGIDGDAHELGHGDRAVVDHLDDVSRVYGEVGGEVGGPGRRQLLHLLRHPAEVPSANDPATSAQVNNDFLMTHYLPKKIAAGRQPGGDPHTAASRRPYYFLEFYRLIGRNRRVKPSGMADWRVTRQGVDAVAEFGGARGEPFQKVQSVAGKHVEVVGRISSRWCNSTPICAITVCAHIPGTNTRGCRSRRQPFASTARARAASRSTARPWLWSTTAARSRRRSRRLRQSSPSRRLPRPPSRRRARARARCRPASWMPALVPDRRPDAPPPPPPGHAAPAPAPAPARGARRSARRAHPAVRGHAALLRARPRAGSGGAAQARTRAPSGSTNTGCTTSTATVSSLSG